MKVSYWIGLRIESSDQRFREFSPPSLEPHLIIPRIPEFRRRHSNSNPSSRRNLQVLNCCNYDLRWVLRQVSITIWKKLRVLGTDDVTEIVGFETPYDRGDYLLSI
jgi:hypothetical protein